MRALPHLGSRVTNDSLLDFGITVQFHRGPALLRKAKGETHVFIAAGKTTAVLQSVWI